MADAAVRVDIIVGQNTVVPAVERTTATLTQATRTASSLNVGFDNLSKQGLRRLEGGFQALAFSAAGVPGPLGKIASGAVLLGGGSGVLLGVAAAAGAVALAWQKLTSVGDDATKAIDRMTAALKKNQQALLDIDAGDRATNDLTSRAGWLMGAAGFIPGMQAVVNHLLGMAGGIRQVTSAYAAFEAHSATDDFLLGFNKNHPIPKAKAGKVGPDRTSQDWWLNQDFSQQSAVLDLKNQMADLNAELATVQVNMDGVGSLLDGINQQFADSADRVQMYAEIFANGFLMMSDAIGSAISGAQTFGEAMKGAILGFVADAARAMSRFEMAEAIASFAAALGPIPRPWLMAAGYKHLAAAAAYGVAGGIAAGLAQGGGASRAATGGVNADRVSREQSDVARGTVTVSMKDGFIRPSDPAFQEFLAQVIKEAKGRNVVFA